MVCCAWGSLLSSRIVHSHTSSSSAFSRESKLIIPYTRERREHRIFQQLLQMIPGLEDRLMNGSSEYVVHVGELVCHHPIPKLYETDATIDPKRLCERPGG